MPFTITKPKETQSHALAQCSLCLHSMILCMPRLWRDPMLTARELTSHVGRLVDNAWELVDDFRRGKVQRQDIWFVAWTVWQGRTVPVRQAPGNQKKSRQAPKELSAKPEIIVEKLSCQRIEIDDQSIEKPTTPITILDYTKSESPFDDVFAENEATTPERPRDAVESQEEHGEETASATANSESEENPGEQMKTTLPSPQLNLELFPELETESLDAQAAASDNLIAISSPAPNEEVHAYASFTPLRPQAWVRPNVCAFAKN